MHVGLHNNARARPPAGGRCWQDLALGHEMFCVGHFVEAWVALNRCGGEARMVAGRLADHLERTFGPGGGTAWTAIPSWSWLVELPRGRGAALPGLGRQGLPQASRRDGGCSRIMRRSAPDGPVRLPFDDVDAGLAPIRMVPNGRPDEEFVPMIVPGGSVCLYSFYTRHAASDFTATRGHRPVMWVGFTRKDRPWDGARTFTYKSGASPEAMRRFIAEATPRQRELLGFPPPGDPLWTEAFTAAMATRYPGFDPAPHHAARAR